MNKFILPIIVLFVGNAAAVMLMFTGPDAKKQQKRPHIPLVETQILNKQSYTTKVRSSGKVRASTQTKLVAEVAGSIVKVSPKFDNGQYFKKGDILLQIEDSDFVNAVTVAQAEVEQRRLQLKEEKARAELAKKDWSLLDTPRSPGDLAVRKPHIASAESALKAAEARLQQAKKNLDRTYIKAPYSGQVLSRNVDIGQYVSPGTGLGEVYAKNVLEVHLPVSLRQFKQLDLEDQQPKTKTPVEFYMVQGRKKTVWQGNVIRSSAALDASTNQLSVIAKIEEGKNSKIKIGQFVRANIFGQVYKDIYIVPRSSVRQNKEVLVLNNVEKDQAEVSVIPIEVIRIEGDKSIIKGEFADNLQLIVTPMPLAKAGLKIRIKQKNKRKPDAKKAWIDTLSTPNT